MRNKSWKTTSTGITMIVSSLVGAYFAWESGNLNESSITALLTAFLGGIGFLFSKDSDRTGLPKK